ncbi:MAG: hypothetical protein AB1571_02900 [Nanoarchaeota archaeon]
MEEKLHLSVNSVLIILLVVVILISVVQAVFVLGILNSLEKNAKLVSSETLGQVKLYVIPKPTITGGEVELNVINNEKGGS